MNNTLLGTLTAAALACASLAFAQDPATSADAAASRAAQDSASQQSTTTSGGTIDDQSGMNTGSNAATRPTTVASNATWPSFDSLDSTHHGYLMQSDVTSNSVLSARFNNCDTNHDGLLSRTEYNACINSSGAVQQ